MKSFGTALLVASVLEIVGWIVVALAVLAFVYLYSEANIEIALPVGIGGGIQGLFMVAAAQLIHAQVSTAESAQRSEEHLSKILSTLQKQAQAEPDTIAPGAKIAGSGTLIREAFGHQIFKKDGSYHVDGRSFKNLSYAEDHARRNAK